MKKFFAVLLSFALLFPVCGCSENQREITCEEVIAAYENAGYEVWHSDNHSSTLNYVCCIQADDPETGEYISFHFFKTEEEAEAYADERQYHILIWMFSVIYGDPSWLTTKTYRNIEIEYDHSYLYKPFKGLL